MFGNNDDNQQNNNNQPISTQPVNPGLLGIDDESNIEPSNPLIPTEPTTAPIPEPPIPPTPSISVTPDPSAQTQISSTAPVVSPTLSSSAITGSVNDNISTSTNDQDNIVTSTSANPVKISSLPSSEELVDIKRQALQELTPLIDHLNQNPEEKFKTTMMMIQATDDQDLIPRAFSVAKEIPDEKMRAQALLDIVNEINYFTHKSDD